LRSSADLDNAIERDPVEALTVTLFQPWHRLDEEGSIANADRDFSKAIDLTRR
jgi:hypothetical protein